MQMQRVRSTMLAAVGYDPATRRLALEYKSGKTYTHRDVPPEEYAELMRAPSAGQYVNESIKPNFACSEE